MSEYDVIVVGSGLAGLTAGLFSARHGLSTLILESNIPGGHLISIEKIEDFPGFPDGIPGYELAPNLQRQAADYGAEFQRAEVVSLETRDRFWTVATEEERHRAKAVIVATGSALKNLGVPGEEKLTGRGVSHCASCDGPLYNGQTVGVVGGGDSALQEAMTLVNYAERVLIFHDGENFSAQQSYQQRVLGNTKIKPRYRKHHRRSFRRRGCQRCSRTRLGIGRDIASRTRWSLRLRRLTAEHDALAESCAAQRHRPRPDGQLDENRTQWSLRRRRHPARLGSASDHFRRRGRHRGYRSISVHHGDFSLVCCLTTWIKKRRCMICHSRENGNRAPVMAPHQHGESPCRSMPQLRSRR